MRPEVARLWADLDSTIEQCAAGDWHHRDGTPFTDAERELVATATLAEVEKGAAIVQAECDQADAAVREAER